MLKKDQYKYEKNIFTGIKKYLKNEFLFIFIDEIEKILTMGKLDEAEKMVFLTGLKNWVENAKKQLVFVVAGTPDCLSFFIEQYRGLLGGRFEVLVDPYLSEEEVKFYIENKCHSVLQEQTIFPLEEDAVGFIHKISMGLPRFIEIISFECWNIASDEKITIDSRVIKKFIISKFQKTFQEICNKQKLNEKQRFALIQLLFAGGKAHLRELVRPTDDDYNTIWGGLYSLSEDKEGIVQRTSRGLYEINEDWIIEMFTKHYGGY